MITVTIEQLDELISNSREFENNWYEFERDGHISIDDVDYDDIKILHAIQYFNVELKDKEIWTNNI